MKHLLIAALAVLLASCVATPEERAAAEMLETQGKLQALRSKIKADTQAEAAATPKAAVRPLSAGTTTSTVIVTVEPGCTFQYSSAKPNEMVFKCTK